MSGIVNFNYLQVTSVIKANDTLYTIDAFHTVRHPDAYLLLYMHSGQLLVHTQTSFSLNPHELVIVPCDTPVSYAAAVPNSQVLTIIFQGSAAHLKPLLSHVWLQQDHHLPQAVSTDLATIIDLRKRKPNQTYDRELGEYFMVSCAKLYTDLTQLLLALATNAVQRRLPKAQTDTPQAPAAESTNQQLHHAKVQSGALYKKLLVNQVIDYMHEHLGAQLTIETIAQEFLLGDSNLKKMFKAQTGVSIMTYFKQLKMQRAITLVTQHELSYTQIANQLGFSSIHHFSEAFKHYTGASPTQYYASLHS